MACRGNARPAVSTGFDAKAAAEALDRPEQDAVRERTSSRRQSDEFSLLSKFRRVGSLEFHTSFIQAHPDKPYSREPIRQMTARVLNSHYFDAFVAACTFTAFAIIIVDTNSRASHESLPFVFEVVQLVLLLLQIFEFLAHVFVERCLVWRSAWNIVDIVVIMGALLDYIMVLAGAEYDLGLMRMLRLVRIARLLKAICRLPLLRELRKLVLMVGGCMKTLFWSSLLLSLAMTIWAIVMVEALHPLATEMAAAGAWAGCDRCPRAFSSVFHANLTMFSTIVAGDSWGVLAIPIIEAHPWTALIFAGTLLTLVFGILNLIVAVIVDTFAEARSKDVFTRAQELAWEERQEKKLLAHIFSAIDADSSGCVDLDELIDGAQKSPDFASWLRVMDVDSKDLREMFHMLDLNGNHAIDIEEFVETMYRLKNCESRTTIRFIKEKLEYFSAHHKETEAKLEDVRLTLATLPMLNSSLNQVSSHLVESEDHIKKELHENEAHIKQSLEACVHDAVEHALIAAAGELQKTEKLRMTPSASPRPTGPLERSESKGSAGSRRESKSKRTRSKEHPSIPQATEADQLLLCRASGPACASTALGQRMSAALVSPMVELQGAGPLPECRKSPHLLCVQAASLDGVNSDLAPELSAGLEPCPRPHSQSPRERVASAGSVRAAVAPAVTSAEETRMPATCATRRPPVAYNAGADAAAAAIGEVAPSVAAAAEGCSENSAGSEFLIQARAPDVRIPDTCRADVSARESSAASAARACNEVAAVIELERALPGTGAMEARGSVSVRVSI